MSLIEFSAQRRFDGITIDASFTADAGVTALFGASGAGKTTVVNMLAGLERPDAGRIVVGGMVLFDSDQGVNLAPEHRRLGYVFQEDRLFPHFSVARNLTYGGKGGYTKDRPVDMGLVTKLLGLAHLLDRRPATLSGGEKQRVAIGRALLANPAILLMDEPMAALDATRRAEILPFLEQMREQLDIPIVYVSHNVDEVLRLADTMVVMGEGETKASGPVAEILSRIDLRQWTGIHDAGTVITATVGDQADDGLTALKFNGGALQVARLHLTPGRQVRLRIHAKDVSLALEKPNKISVLNIFPGKILEVSQTKGAQADVRVDIGGASWPVPIWAQVTKRSATDLGLAPGTKVFALVKAVAVDREDIGPGPNTGHS
jgi:molybdate transport system ATP-binding protein